METFYKISSYLLFILGVIHTLMTRVFYQPFSIDALWFAGTGLGLVFLGLLNITSLKIYMSSVYNITIFANILFTLYSVFVVIVLPEPQAFIVILLIICALIGSITIRMQCQKK